MSAPPIILASKSTARRAVLEGAGVAFEAVGSGVDEDEIKRQMLGQRRTPRQIAEALAEAKAQAVSASRPGLVVGADQTLELDGGLFDKVETIAEAGDRLRLLRGKAHQLHAAVAVAEEGRTIWRETDSTTLTMRAFSETFLTAYLAAEGDSALGSVGCYRLEGMGVQLFSKIEGDYFSILGLPLVGLLELFRQREVLAS